MPERCPLCRAGGCSRVALNTSLASRAVNGRPADQLPAGQLRYNWYLAAEGGTTRRYHIAPRPARRWGRCEGAGAVGWRSTFGRGEGAKKPLDAAQMHLGVSVGYMAIKAFWGRCGAVEGYPTVLQLISGLGYLSSHPLGVRPAQLLRQLPKSYGVQLRHLRVVGAVLQ